ncbi:MAG TPA: LysE family transporter [Chitinophagales bacterium]|nr:LysE family translocator [Chitinophagales bacterium]MCB9074709.1 LysE family transporter [Chitinophagales bacterium]HMU98453.1 LysE family transporter [Chitinophagales bacterium]HMV03442.1 LysE family transporter [Chitinophagales bacterium]HMW94925.1 LysE family transporter [Chitinophagales bacterium]
MEVALKGISIGVMVSFLIGPIFLGLIDITITRGWKSGLAYILAIIVSDAALIILINEIFTEIHIEKFKFYVGLIGGIILMLFGVITFISKTNLKGVDTENVKTIGGAFLKGVSINLTNPFVIVWWMGLYTATAVQGYTSNEKFIYYFFILFTIFFFDLLKMRFGYYLKYNLSVEKLSMFKKLVGISLFIFGIVMMLRVLL